MFELISLPYSQDALAPVISAQTLSFHHGKHLQTYVTNLNNAIKGTALESLSLEQIVLQSDGGTLNNAGQVLNHNLYFLQFKACGAAANVPGGKIGEAIMHDFGSLENFYAEFEKQGTTLFGSGWVWLAADKSGKLVISQEKNASNPILHGHTPLLTFDVWEHAYYLDYQNRRADQLKALWQIIDWEVINKRYEGQ